MGRLKADSLSAVKVETPQGYAWWAYLETRKGRSGLVVSGLLKPGK